MPIFHSLSLMIIVADWSQASAFFFLCAPIDFHPSTYSRIRDVIFYYRDTARRENQVYRRNVVVTDTPPPPPFLLPPTRLDILIAVTSSVTPRLPRYPESIHLAPQHKVMACHPVTLYNLVFARTLYSRDLLALEVSRFDPSSPCRSMRIHIYFTYATTFRVCQQLT
ncbi:hypothetical protein QR685DRAFT_157262 [Neurospora intermedia]|uniref:Secreted protein n=1 Tax=Neurospora intermedia TaxID=5142 RepID=A0ABR3DKY7_NEUIN